MSQSKQPSREQVRAYLQQRQQSHTPPPDPQEVRRQLGWDLEPMPPPTRR